jgi:phosphopantetheine adenylyltransferase
MSKLNYGNLIEKNNILDKEQLLINGRVNLLEQPNTDVLFKMQERIEVKNKTTEYREAVNGIVENTVLSDLFFSKENIQIIQNGIRAGIYKKSNEEYLIAPQNIDTVKTIMRSIFFQYAEYTDNITDEIIKLNKLVLDYAIPNVYNSLISYLKYMKDQSTLVVPLELPRQTDRDYKQLELKQYI